MASAGLGEVKRSQFRKNVRATAFELRLFLEQLDHQTKKRQSLSTTM